MAQSPPEESAFGLAPNIAAGIASFFGWIGGLIVLLGKPPQQWVRFIAVQSILLAVAYVIIAIARSYSSEVPIAKACCTAGLFEGSFTSELTT